MNPEIDALTTPDARDPQHQVRPNERLQRTVDFVARQVMHRRYDARGSMRLPSYTGPDIRRGYQISRWAR